MKQRKPLKRSGSLARTGRIKQRSEKRKRENATEVNDMATFRAEWHGSPCWVCGRDLSAHGMSMDARGTIDHICGRNHPQRHHRTNLLWAAWGCHRDIIPSMSIVEKVNRKLLYDPAGFDERVFLPIRRAKDGRIDF